jgi:hypothetical protein
MNPLAADLQFCDALLAGDAEALDRILAAGFVLIDVMSGSEVTRSDFLAAIGFSWILPVSF